MFPLCHGSSEDATEEMPAKKLRNTQQIYQVWLLLIISTVLYCLDYHNLW